MDTTNAQAWASPVKEQSEYPPGTLKRIEGQVETLSSVIGSLEERLTPILHAESPEATNDPAMPPTTQIQEVASRLDYLITRLSSIRERVDL